jgi:hypothetical protein
MRWKEERFHGSRLLLWFLRVSLEDKKITSRVDDMSVRLSVFT